LDLNPNTNLGEQSNTAPQKCSNPYKQEKKCLLMSITTMPIAFLLFLLKREILSSNKKINKFLMNIVSIIYPQKKLLLIVKLTFFFSLNFVFLKEKCSVTKKIVF